MSFRFIAFRDMHQEAGNKKTAHQGGIPGDIFRTLVPHIERFALRHRASQSVAGPENLQVAPDANILLFTELT